ncbi:MAG: DUF488 domain-containing protein [Bacteroidia bacterium]
MAETSPQIWTIGHSTHSGQEFIGLLQECEIEVLADVRTFPGSKRFPQFNKEQLRQLLGKHHIDYRHFLQLGGRRKSTAGSVNAGLKHASFRGYADYMQSPEFTAALCELETLAHQKRLVYMCAEALWWNCHRALISDALKFKGWTVLHIMAKGKIQEHPYTSAASFENGQLSYRSKTKTHIQGKLDL